MEVCFYYIENNVYESRNIGYWILRTKVQLQYKL